MQRLPQSRLYGIGLNVLKYWPLPNDSAGYAATGSYNYQNIKPTVKSHGRQEAFRGDYQFSPKLRASGKLLTQDRALTRAEEGGDGGRSRMNGHRGIGKRRVERRQDELAVGRLDVRSGNEHVVTLGGPSR